MIDVSSASCPDAVAVYPAELRSEREEDRERAVEQYVAAGGRIKRYSPEGKLVTSYGIDDSSSTSNEDRNCPQALDTVRAIEFDT